MKRLILALWLLAGPALAVQPDEVLDDPALEARARAISQGLRCPVCQNESIDESNAPIARDLRILLRERLTEGDTDAEAVDYLVARYGEFILLRPTAEGANIVLWIAGPLMLLTGLGVGLAAIRRRPAAGADALTEAEEAELQRLLKD